MESIVLNSKTRLLGIDEVAPFLQFNKYIRTGYRATPSCQCSKPKDNKEKNSFVPDCDCEDTCSKTLAFGCESTFCSFHNETGNIWTHMASIPLYLTILFSEVFLSESPRWNLIAATFGFLVTNVCSVYYHSTMHVCRTRVQYTTCLNVDLSAIFFALAVTGVSTILYAFPQNPHLLPQSNSDVFADDNTAMSNELRYVIALIFVLLNVFMCIELHKPHATVHTRLVVVGMAAISRTLLAAYFTIPPTDALQQNCPAVDGTHSAQTDGRQSLYLNLGAFAFMAVGGVINGLRLPERFTDKLSLRCFDFIGNSHNLWHLCIVASSSCILLSAMYDSLHATGSKRIDPMDEMRRFWNRFAEFFILRFSELYAIPSDVEFLDC